MYPILYEIKFSSVDCCANKSRLCSKTCLQNIQMKKKYKECKKKLYLVNGSQPEVKICSRKLKL